MCPDLCVQRTSANGDTDYTLPQANSEALIANTHLNHNPSEPPSAPYKYLPWPQGIVSLEGALFESASFNLVT